MNSEISATTFGSRRQKVLLLASTALGLVLGLEVFARFVVEPPIPPTYGEYQRALDAAGLGAMSELIESDPVTFWRLKRNLRRHKVEKDAPDKKITFIISTHNSLRSAPVPPTKNRFRILVLGDSTSFGWGVDDRACWPGELQALLDRKGFDVRVINAAVPGYTAYQGLKYLRSEGLTFQPDLVIASFGISEPDTWASSSDVRADRTAGLESWERPLLHSRMYVGLRSLLRGAGAISPSPLDQTDVTSGPAGGFAAASVAIPRLSLDELRESLLAIKKLCDQKNINLLTTIWPTPAQAGVASTTLTAYQATIESFSRDEQIPQLSVLDLFARADRSMLLDRVHTSREGSIRIAYAVFRKILPLLAQTGTVNRQAAQRTMQNMGIPGR